MPTETDQGPTDEVIRARFHDLGHHLASADDLSLSPPDRLPRRAAGSGRPALAAAAVLVLALGIGTWALGRGSDEPTTVSTDGSIPSTDVAPATTTEPWPPHAEVHEHCIEDDPTRTEPTPEIRAQACESFRHDDVLVGVMIDGEAGIGAVRSGDMNDDTADAFQDALVVDAVKDLDQSKRDTLASAFQIRHAIPVVDRDGAQIGWWGSSFVSLDDMPAIRADAERIIAEFERTGTVSP